DNRLRWYSPTLQVFVSQDPLSFVNGYTNFYERGGNNPLNTLDESGYQDRKEFDAEWEEKAGLSQAIKKKTLEPIEGVNGKTFKVESKHTVEFEFLKAYVGEYKPPDKPDIRVGVYARIAAKVLGKVNCKGFTFVQIVRHYEHQEGKDNPVSVEPRAAVRELAG